MNVVEQLQTLMIEDISELQRLQKRRWWTWPMTRIVKEEHIGRCCYLAEEFLAGTELQALKEKIGLDERPRWRELTTSAINLDALGGESHSLNLLGTALRGSASMQSSPAQHC